MYVKKHMSSSYVIFELSSYTRYKLVSFTQIFFFFTTFYLHDIFVITEY